MPQPVLTFNFSVALEPILIGKMVGFLWSATGRKMCTGNLLLGLRNKIYIYLFSQKAVLLYFYGIFVLLLQWLLLIVAVPYVDRINAIVRYYLYFNKFLVGL